MDSICSLINNSQQYVYVFKFNRSECTRQKLSFSSVNGIPQF